MTRKERIAQLNEIIQKNKENGYKGMSLYEVLQPMDALMKLLHHELQEFFIKATTDEKPSNPQASLEVSG